MSIANRIWGIAIPLAGGVFVTALLLVLLGALSRSVSAAPASSFRFVTTAGSDVANDCTVIGSPCRTVQHALDVAQTSDNVYVAVGTFTSTNGTVANITKSVTLVGGWNSLFTQIDPANNPTVLDGQGLQPVILISSPVTLSASAHISPSILGLIITNGHGRLEGCQGQGPTSECGGGIASLYANPVIVNNVISNNVGADSPDGDGGGLFIFSATAASVISNNLFIHNIANIGGPGFGGGLFALVSNAAIEDNRFLSNTASSVDMGVGGGFIHDRGQPTISGNWVSGNVDGIGVQSSGAGLSLSFSNASLVGNTILNNHSGGSGGGLDVYGAQAEAVVSGNVILTNTALVEGGGVFIANSHSVLVSMNTIAANHAISPTAGRGGGVRVGYGNSLVTITQNNVYSNVTAWGGGSGIDVSSPGLVDGNFIHQNQTTAWGGALLLADSPAMTATNNVVFNNIGSGIQAVNFAGTVALFNNTVVSNFDVGDSAGLGILIYFDVTPTTGITATVVNNILADGESCGLDVHNGPLVVSNHNDVWGNAFDYCEQAASAGNISADPLFLNAAAHNYHLSAGSSAINAGTNAGAPATDKDGTSRPQAGVVDIGAYEFFFYNLRLPLLQR